MTSGTPRPRRRADGERSRQAILEAAARLATVEGLDGLSIGRLADEVGMSKSGLFAHFGSKQELQLETIAAADAVFAREVVAPATAADPGVARVLALADAFLAHIERGVFPGGCFFAAAAAEMGVRPGPVRDRIQGFVVGWLGALQTALEEARGLGEIDPEADAGQLAFEINAMLLGANLAFPLFGDPRVLDRARVGVRTRLATTAVRA
ncbi:MAG: TetR/AcrR family transcriptional regulator [Thermoleophilia bacterium]